MSTKAAAISIPGIPDDFFVVKASGLSQAQALTAYLGGSAFQTIMDNPITAYRYVAHTSESAGDACRFSNAGP
jgi:hypothetical protein